MSEQTSEALNFGPQWYVSNLKSSLPGPVVLIFFSIYSSYLNLSSLIRRIYNLYCLQSN